MTPPPTLPSDRQLLDAARRGDTAAWAELTQRHRQALATVLGGGRGQKRAVDTALSEVRDRLLTERSVDSGDPGIRAARPALIAAVTDGFYGPAWPGVLPVGEGDVPPPSGDDELLALAFSTLPEPWQTALWHRHVDGESASQIAPHLGRDAGDVPEVLDTAERGLIDAFFREYSALGPFEPEAAAVVPLLAGHHAGRLDATDDERVVEHLRLARIAVAPDVPGAVTSTSPGAGLEPPGVLDPPRLRRHDAVDSRRLLALAANLDRRLAPAIAPGVTKMIDESVLPTPPPPRSTARADRRRRLVGVASALLLIAGVVLAAFVVRNGTSGDGDATAPGSTVSGDPNVGSGTEPDPTDPGSTTPETASPSTSLALRPDALGPLNTIEVTVDTGDGPLGLTAAEPGVSVSASAPAPVYAGGSGTIDLTVRNDTDAVNAVGVTFSLPRGVRFERGAGGLCDDPDDESPRCLLEVGAGSSELLTVRFRLESSIVGRLELDGDLTEPFVTPIDVTPDLVHSSVGNGGIIVAGNTVTRCSPGAAAPLGIDCDDVTDGVGEVVNRWDVPIEFVGRASQFALFNSSSVDVTLPDGAQVVEAHLYWSGDLDERGESIPDDGRTNAIALGLPGGRVQTIEAGRVVLGDVDASQYLGSNDVTDLVRSGGSGRYTVGNVQTVEVQGSYGAWALVVVYDHPDEPRRHRLITRPFEWVAPEGELGEVYEYAVDLPVAAVDGGAATLDVFALEGELGFEPERLTVGGQRLGGDNPFDSSIGRDARRPDPINNLGVDLDTYDLIIDASDGILPIRAMSEQDGVRIAVLGLTVDLDE